MNKSLISMMLLTTVSAFGLAACDNKGPAEQAGEKLDNSVEQLQEKSKDAADSTKEALGLKEKGTMEKLGEKLDETGQSIKEGTNEQVDNAREAMGDASDAADKKLEELTSDNNN